MEDYWSESSIIVPETPEPVRRNFRSLFHEFKTYYGSRDSCYDDWEEVAALCTVTVEYKPNGFSGCFEMHIKTKQSCAFSYFQNFFRNLPEIKLKNGGKSSCCEIDTGECLYYLIFEGKYELFGYFNKDFEKFMRVRFKPVKAMQFLINLI